MAHHHHRPGFHLYVDLAPPLLSHTSPPTTQHHHTSNLHQPSLHSAAAAAAAAAPPSLHSAAAAPPPPEDDDGVHGNRMKPLSSFHINHAPPSTSSLHTTGDGANTPDLKTFPPATGARKAKEKMASSSSYATSNLKQSQCKENAIIPQVTDGGWNHYFPLKQQQPSTKRKSFGSFCRLQARKRQCGAYQRKPSTMFSNQQEFKSESDKNTLPLISCFQPKSQDSDKPSVQSHNLSCMRHHRDSMSSMKTDCGVGPNDIDGKECSPEQTALLSLFKVSTKTSQPPKLLSPREHPAEGLCLLGAAACLSLALDEDLGGKKGACKSEIMSCTLGMGETGGDWGARSVIKPLSKFTDSLSNLGTDLFLGRPSVAPSSYAPESMREFQENQMETSYRKESSICAELPCVLKENANATISNKDNNVIEDSKSSHQEERLAVPIEVLGELPMQCESASSMDAPKKNSQAADYTNLRLFSFSPSELASGSEVAHLYQPLEAFDSHARPEAIVMRGGSEGEIVHKPEDNCEQHAGPLINPISKVQRPNGCRNEMDDLAELNAQQCEALPLFFNEEHPEKHVQFSSFNAKIQGEASVVVSQFQPVDNLMVANTSEAELSEVKQDRLTERLGEQQKITPNLPCYSMEGASSLSNNQNVSICKTLESVRYNQSSNRFIGKNTHSSLGNRSCNEDSSRTLSYTVHALPQLAKYNLFSTVTAHHSGRVPNAGLHLPRMKRGRRPKRPKVEHMQKKEYIDKFALSSPPCGLLGELNPGIISKIRDSKQVRAILGSVIGFATLTECHEDTCGWKDVVANKDMETEFQGCKDKRTSPGRIKIVGNMQDSSAWKDLSCANIEQGGEDEIFNGTAIEEEAQKRLAACLETEVSSNKSSAHIDNIHGLYSCSVEDDRPTIGADCRNPENDVRLVATQAQNKLDNRKYEAGNAVTGQPPKDDESGKVVSENRCTSTERLSGPVEMAENSRVEDSFGRGPTLPPGTEFTEEFKYGNFAATAVSAAANVAARWLELLRLDIKGRLSALKRSRRRVRSVIVSDEGFSVGNVPPSTDCTASVAEEKHVGASRTWSKDESFRQYELEMDRWRALFLHMDGVLSAEGAKLEGWLSQISEMQVHCQGSLIPPQSRLDYNRLQALAVEGGNWKGPARWLSSETMEKDLAMAASAASIFCTANFLTTLETQIRT